MCLSLLKNHIYSSKTATPAKGTYKLFLSRESSGRCSEGVVGKVLVYCWGRVGPYKQRFSALKWQRQSIKKYSLVEKWADIGMRRYRVDTHTSPLGGMGRCRGERTNVLLACYSANCYVI